MSKINIFVCVGQLGVLFGYEMVFVASVQIQALLSDLFSHRGLSCYLGVTESGKINENTFFFALLCL